MRPITPYTLQSSIQVSDSPGSRAALHELRFFTHAFMLSFVRQSGKSISHRIWDAMLFEMVLPRLFLLYPFFRAEEADHRVVVRKVIPRDNRIFEDFKEGAATPTSCRVADRANIGRRHPSTTGVTSPSVTDSDLISGFPDDTNLFACHEAVSGGSGGRWYMLCMMFLFCGYPRILKFSCPHSD